MLGTAGQIQTHQIEVFHGAFTSSGPISNHINEWLSGQPIETQIIDIKYGNYTLPDANDEMALGETALIIYKTTG